MGGCPKEWVMKWDMPVCHKAALPAEMWHSEAL